MQQYIGLAFVYLSTRIFLLQNKYANKLLWRFRMVNNNPISTLMEERLQLQSNMGEEFVDQLMYKSMVRSLIFLTHSRPYISFVVSCVNWYLGANSFHYYKKDLWYIKGTCYGVFYPHACTT
jgi:hypothetical protein